MGFKELEDIEVWKRTCRLVVMVYKLTDKGELGKDWGLKDQMRRAAVSIPSNIAEGFERSSKSEFNRFAIIAKGSCGELRTQLYLSQALDYLSKSEIEPLLNECKEISLMLGGLSRHLKLNK